MTMKDLKQAHLAMRLYFRKLITYDELVKAMKKAGLW